MSSEHKPHRDNQHDIDVLCDLLDRVRNCARRGAMLPPDLLLDIDDAIGEPSDG